MTTPEALTKSPSAALLSIEAAARYSGLSRSTIYREIAAGNLHPVTVRSRRYVAKAEIAAYVTPA